MTVTYVNNIFSAVRESTNEEFKVYSFSILGYPDKSKVIFKMFWNHLKSGKIVNAIVKNLSKTRTYYSIIMNFGIVKIL